MLSWVAAAPLSTRIRQIPTAVRLTPELDGVPRPCVVTLDNLQSVRTDWLESRVTLLSHTRMQEVDQAIRFALGLPEIVGGFGSPYNAGS